MSGDYTGECNTDRRAGCGDIPAIIRRIEGGPSLSELRLEAVVSRHVGPVSLRIAPGECVCLSGGSGAGKSLLLRAIADLDPHEGEIYLDGASSASYPAPQWRRRIGYLPAESQWWYSRVGPHFNGVASGWLEALGFDDSVMDWTISRMSTGERQRMALLRLLCNGPVALLLDEPTASLDPAGGRRAEELIRDYRTDHGAPVLWVSHDDEQIHRVAHRHFRLRDGRLIEQPM